MSVNKYFWPIIDIFEVRVLSPLAKEGRSGFGHTVERSIDLATVGRTMMEASLAWPDSFRRGLAT